MKKTLKKYFIPHAENNYHPHIFHPHRIAWYGVFFVGIKLIVLLFVIALPFSAFVMPDILAAQQQRILALTNDLREQNGLSPLTVEDRLFVSADNKAQDMSARQYFSHKGPDDRTVREWIRGAGYSYSVAGENLAMGFPTADDVLSAWIKSPTHYANLIDPEFKSFGVGLEPGLYNGMDTVYVAQHFASPSEFAKPAKQNAKPTLAVAAAPVAIVKEEHTPVEQVKEALNKDAEVLAVKVSNEIVFDADNSRVIWKDADDKTLLTVEAKISGIVKSATVAIGKYSIDLQVSRGELYDGELLVSEKSDDLFRVAVLPTITITGMDGKVTTENINWQTIKVVGMTPMQKYFESKELFSPISNVFSVSRNIYLFFIILFGLAFIINIVVEIKKQHFHVILLSALLLGLLVCLWLI